MELPEDDPDILDTFIGLLYTPRYELVGRGKSDDRDEAVAARNETNDHDEVVTLFCLAERFQCAEVKTCLVDAIFKWEQEGDTTASMDNLEDT